jgi:hypothetical protein
MEDDKIEVKDLPYSDVYQVALLKAADVVMFAMTFENPEVRLVETILTTISLKLLSAALAIVPADKKSGFKSQFIATALKLNGEEGGI